MSLQMRSTESVRVSRTDDLRRLLDLYPTAEDALAAGNYYVAARREDATPEIRAAALTLAGFHLAGHRLFRTLQPTQPLVLFAQALACLFVQGRTDAIRCLDAAGPLAGPPAALRAVLANGSVRVHFVTAWKHWLDRVASSCADADGHGLDLQIRTVSCHEGADLKIDFNGPDFLRAMSDVNTGAVHAANIFFDDLELVPLRFYDSAIPNIKVIIDYHHSVARMLEQMELFDHLVPYGAETHERLRRMFGVCTPTLLHISDLGIVSTIPQSDAAADLVFTGALLKDCSPRREALVHRLVEEVDESRLFLADGVVPAENYAQLTGGCSIVPTVLEEGGAVPVPRFYEALNSGANVAVDDPIFAAMAYPEHATQFVDVEAAFRYLHGPMRLARRPGPLSASELRPSDQLLHLALVAPLATSAARPGRAKSGSSRLLLNSNLIRRDMLPPSLGAMLHGRATALAQAGATPLIVLDIARFHLGVAEAHLHFLRNERSIDVDPGLARTLDAIVDRGSAAGLSRFPLKPEYECSPIVALLIQAALILLSEGGKRFPDSLALAFEYLSASQTFRADPEVLQTLVATMRQRRADYRYDTLQSDPGPVGTPLADCLARAVLNGEISVRADIARVATAAIWHLVDLVEAAAALAAGRTVDAGAVTRRVLVECPGHLAAGDLLVRIWDEDPLAAYGQGGGRRFFRQALHEVLAESPARQMNYGLPLAAAALELDDRASAEIVFAASQRWMTKLILPAHRAAPQQERFQRLTALMQGNDGREADPGRVGRAHPATER